MTAAQGRRARCGAYVNECDYFQKDWQKSFWGANYARLAGIKRRTIRMGSSSSTMAWAAKAGATMGSLD